MINFLTTLLFAIHNEAIAFFQTFLFSKFFCNCKHASQRCFIFGNHVGGGGNHRIGFSDPIYGDYTWVWKSFNDTARLNTGLAAV